MKKRVVVQLSLLLVASLLVIGSARKSMMRRIARSRISKHTGCPKSRIHVTYASKYMARATVCGKPMICFKTTGCKLVKSQAPSASTGPGAPAPKRGGDANEEDLMNGGGGPSGPGAAPGGPAPSGQPDPGPPPSAPAGPPE